MPKKKAKDDGKLKDAVRVHSIEIVKTEGDYKAVRQMLRTASEQAVEVVNAGLAAWYLWHVQNGSRAKIVKFLDAYALWKQDKTRKKPVIDVEFATPAVNKLIYRACMDMGPTLHGRVKSLLQNKYITGYKSKPASNGNLAAWMMALLYREGVPAFKNTLPIPFDVANSKLEPPATKDGGYRLSVRFTKMDGDKGKPAKSEPIRFELKSRGRHTHTSVETMRKICSGESKFMGSNLKLDTRTGKMFVELCYRKQCEQAAAVHKDKILVVRAGHNSPWRCRVAQGSFSVVGRGSAIAAVRRRVLTQRWSRQEHYRFAGSSLKGHGQKRAMLPFDKLALQWRNFVSEYNWSLAKRVTEIARDRGCGTVVMVMPGVWRDSRYVSVAGKVEGRHDSSSWDFFQAKSRLSQKCHQNGLAFEAKETVRRNTGRQGAA